MNVRKLIILLLLGVAAFIVFTQARKLGQSAQPVAVAPVVEIEKVEYVDILVAAENVSEGTRLFSTAIEWKEWPVEALSPSFITSEDRPDAIEELTNSIVRTAILEGEPISEIKLVKAGESGIIAALLKPGMRAVTTRISVDTAAGGFILPGDRVDIILTESIQQRNSGNTATGQLQRVFIAKTIFSDVHVLAIDQTYATAPEDGTATVIGSTATFEMSQKDAEILQEAVAKGDLSLTLRGIRNSQANARSAATTAKSETGQQSIITVYRDGETQQVAIRGQ